MKASFSDNYTGTGSVRKMFLASVLCGRFTKGDKHFRKPPPLNTSDPNGPAYNSCVDNVNNPSMFVIFDYSQCYPEYLIEYKP